MFPSAEDTAMCLQDFSFSFLNYIFSFQFREYSLFILLFILFCLDLNLFIKTLACVECHLINDGYNSWKP